MNWDGTFIAECGSNHEGDLGRAKKLVRMAYECGAHVCKFQLWTDPEITARGNIPLSFTDFQHLWDYTKTLPGMDLTASAFDDASLDFLLEFKPMYVKFAYSKRFWKEGIEKAMDRGAIPIVSTNLLDAHKITPDAIKLFCIPEYPVLYDIDFSSLSQAPAWLKINGFSDHTCGVYQALCAARTPRIHFIEKHIRLEEGSVPDHWFSVGRSDLVTLLSNLGVRGRYGEAKAVERSGGNS
jgi:sialic acid synthase SpsE